MIEHTNLMQLRFHNQIFFIICPQNFDNFINALQLY